MRSLTTRIAALALVVFATAACGSSPESTDATSGTAPFHAVPVDAVVVAGTADCEFSDGGVGVDGEPGGFLVVCELDLSDRRVSGTERHDRFRWVAEGYGGAVWLVEDAIITNDDGAWSGSAQAAEDREAIPTGEAHYVGEGAYEGLEFHYYFFNADLGAAAEIRGWITGGA